MLEGHLPRSARAGSYPGKRLLDLVLAASGLLVSLPVMAVIALIVRLTMGGPVFFGQRRPGRYTRPFTLLKFRTMTDARGPDGKPFSDGQRLTVLGRFLRQTSLDELPELVNVIRGEMSLVGPRPLLEQYLPCYRDRERLRFLARPGITGLAQASGRNYLSWDDRLELDAVYVETMSFGQDLRILLRTVGQVLRRQGVAADADRAEPWLDEERAVQGGEAGATEAPESPEAVRR